VMMVSVVVSSGGLCFGGGSGGRGSDMIRSWGRAVFVCGGGARG
jgi:hypothetical protein